MRPDSVTRLGRSVIQHGPANDRVYLMKLDPGDMPGIVDDMTRLGRERGYSKLFAKIPEDQADHFKAGGFSDEAVVPWMYRGRATGHFMSKFLDPGRAAPKNPSLLAGVLDTARAKARRSPGIVNVSGVERLKPEHAQDLASLYGLVFKTYPFCITEPEALRQAMAEGTAFYGQWSEEGLAAAASTEPDFDWECAEMTDFATLPRLRGQGAAAKILARMEKDLPGRGIKTAYTIARAESHGMNTVFAKSGYRFGGTLRNNTQIAGKLESMNVWYKNDIL